jgi:hypothetical protein
MTERLTFKTLNERIDALPIHASLKMAPTKRTLWGCSIGFSAAFVGLAGVKLLPSNMTTVVITVTLLVVELIALGVALIPPFPWRIPGFASERREYAELLDHDFVQYQGLIEWLQTFPAEQLEVMSGYAADRLESLKSKQPLLTGAIEKLGVLPIAIALFLQFKNLHWPPDFTWPELIFGFALAWMYWSCLLSVSLQFRAQLFQTLLKRATEQNNKTSIGTTADNRALAAA